MQHRQRRQLHKQHLRRRKASSLSLMPSAVRSAWLTACRSCWLLLRKARDLLAVTVASFLALPAGANAPSVGPPNEIAEFIVTMARYTSWPQTASRNSLTFCYAHGGGMQATAVSPERAWNVKGVPVMWQHISTPLQLSGCNLVWLHADVRPAPREWLAAIGDQPVLTMSNYADFTADSGIVGAYRVGSDWRFEVNLEALQRSRINIAAVALRLSQRPRTVISGGETR
jgi:YfiR/HmsC-like